VDHPRRFSLPSPRSFEREVLTKYFKSPHMASFVRQLNFCEAPRRLFRDSWTTASLFFSRFSAPRPSRAPSDGRFLSVRLAPQTDSAR